MLACLAGCNEESTGPSGVKPYIRILEPKPGTKVKLTDRFRIITESDYDKFGQKLSFAATTDSGKTWVAFILSLEPKTGMNVRDTVTCSLDTLGFSAGEKTKIRVLEYGKVHSAVTDFIEIVP